MERESTGPDRKCPCEYSIGFGILGLILAFVVGFMTSKGVRYKKHGNLVALAGIGVLLLFPYLTGVSIPLELTLLLAGLGYLLGRNRDMANEPHDVKGNANAALRWS